MNDKWTSKFIRIIVFALVALCIILLIQNCQRQQDYERVKQALQATQLKVGEFEEEIGNNNEKIASQQQVILTQREAIDAGLLEIEKLKNVKSQVRVITQTKVDTIFASYDEPIDSVGESQFRTFSVSDPWYSFNGSIMPTGVAIRELQIKNEFSLTIADKKIGFFKTPQPSVILVNKNPYTSTQEMQNIVIVNKEPFYRKPWFWTSIGLGLGWYLKPN